MASRRQRRRRLEMARHHRATQRRRLRAALASAPSGPPVDLGAIDRHMTERGYEQDPRTGRWKRMVPLYTLPDGTTSEARVRRGPSWTGILGKRERKGRR